MAAMMNEDEMQHHQPNDFADDEQLMQQQQAQGQGEGEEGAMSGSV